MRLKPGSRIGFILSLTLVLLVGGAILYRATRSHPSQSSPESGESGGKRMRIDITYLNAPQEVKEAFDYAAEIWSSILISDVPVKVLVLYLPIPSYLGLTIPNGTLNFPGAPLSDTWYPTTLADAISGEDQNPGQYDMNVFLSNSFNWYFGLDQDVPAGSLDFVTIALHELGHGFGFVSIGNVEEGVGGSYGTITADKIPLPLSFPFPDLNGHPSISDRFIRNGKGEALTDTSLFPNPSMELAQAFTSDDLYFSGPEAIRANGGRGPKILAPHRFTLFSSLSHLDEKTFEGNPSGLMTPTTQLTEVHHDPGPITIAMFKDMGWSIADTSSLKE